MQNLLRYSSSVETVEADEAQTISELSETLRSILDTTFADSGKALRSVHAKAHGLLRGEIEVPAGLPPAYAQGMFAKPGRYPVFLRFSTNPGDLLDDNISVPRGLAVKIVGVEGERLPGSEHDTTQDFVLANAPAFAAPDAKAFLKNLRLLAKTTDKAEGAKKVLSAALRGAESVLEAFGTESAMLKSMGGHPKTHILGETFYSQAPLRFGEYVAKIAIVPVAPALADLKDRPVDLDGQPDGLRAAVRDFFAHHEGAWEVRAQLCTDLDRMPVEDASKVWSEQDSPYVTVAKLSAGRQDPWSDEMQQTVDTAMSFSPWHGLASHRPLGSVMRARKGTYQMSSHVRGERSGCPMREPTVVR